MYSDRPQLKGFAIELEETSFVMHVNDISGVAVGGAAVTLTTGSTTVNGQTSQDGCFKGNAKPMTESTITVTAQGYISTTQKFILYPVSSLSSPSNNYVIQVKHNNVVQANASVQITPVGGTTVTGTTDAQGIFQTQIQHDTVMYDVQVSNGITTFWDRLYPFTKFTCGSSRYRVVPVITLI